MLILVALARLNYLDEATGEVLLCAQDPEHPCLFSQPQGIWLCLMEDAEFHRPRDFLCAVKTTAVIRAGLRACCGVEGLSARGGFFQEVLLALLPAIVHLSSPNKVPQSWELRP